MRRRVLSAVGTVAVVGALAAPAMARQSFFHSPSGNIQCELDVDEQGTPTRAYCQTAKPARAATLDRRGRVRSCRGISCLGNGPETAFTLRYGRTTRLGPFACTSRESGMRCVVSRTGRGFVIAKSGVRRVGG